MELVEAGAACINAINRQLITHQLTPVCMVYLLHAKRALGHTSYYLECVVRSAHQHCPYIKFQTVVMKPKLRFMK